MTENHLRCTIPQAGGGSCSCCYMDGCYLDCGGTVPQGGGGDGDGDGDGGGGAYCGDGTCNSPGETCTVCASDCGACPTGNVHVRAMAIPAQASQCTDVVSSTAYIASNVTLFPVGTAKTTPVNGTYAQWNGVPVSTYSMTNVPPQDYVLKFACYSKTGGAPYTNAYSASLGANETIQWHLGYTSGISWAQVVGGDVYATTTMRSYIPSGSSPNRYFVRDGDGGTPGVVTYGTAYDFDSASVGYGESYISTEGWLANDINPATDYYAVMYHRFGSPDADYTGPTTFNAKPASQPDPYYVNGDLAISTVDWSVGNGETLTIIVNGNLTIGRRINITGTGFVAFIVNGDIMVDTAVGTTATSDTSVVEGIYITSPTGTFHTGASTTAAARRFVGEEGGVSFVTDNQGFVLSSKFIEVDADGELVYIVASPVPLDKLSEKHLRWMLFLNLANFISKEDQSRQALGTNTSLLGNDSGHLRDNGKPTVEIIWNK
ncbi:MAG: hypothetical protein FJZ86_03840 [Chloroflexi bacterium]|nr:hypothetical protein [Chloroflexota bacterium]